MRSTLTLECYFYNGDNTMIDKSKITYLTTSIRNFVTREITDHANTTANNSTKGHVQAGGVPQNVSTTASAGTDNGYYARADHVHKGSYNDLADKPSTFTPSSHSHGNISNTGCMNLSTSADMTFFVGSETWNGPIKNTDHIPSSRVKDNNAHSNIGTSANAYQSTINSAIDTAISNKPDLDDIYPIGSIYMTLDVYFSPSQTFGGQWERIKGRFLIGADDTSKYPVESTGGEETHKLTINEMPSHTHTQNQHRHTLGSDWSSGSGSDAGYVHTNNRQTISKNSGYTTATNQNTGGGQAHNNLPPYIAVCIWQRTG